MGNQWISAQRASALFGLTRFQLARLADAGRISCRQIPGLTTRQYDPAELGRIVEGSVRPATTGATT